MNLIAITGRLHAGKDTAAEALVGEGYIKASFADPLKEMVATLADEPVYLYHDQAAKEEFVPLLGMTRRKALQLMGTEGVRNIFGPDLWANRLLARWRRGGCPDMVIADCRFDNEASAVRDAGGVVLRIVRPGNDADSVGIQGHPSEQGVSDHLVDATLINDSTQQDLHLLVFSVLRHLRSGL